MSNWIKIEDERMPLETPILVKHNCGIHAIHFWKAKWKFWYSGKPVVKEVIENITHWCDPNKIQ
jgi:hypothetical protein